MQNNFKIQTFVNQIFFKRFAIQVAPVVLCKVCGPLMGCAPRLIETNGYQTQSEDDDDTDIYLLTNLYDPHVCTQNGTGATT